MSRIIKAMAASGAAALRHIASTTRGSDWWPSKLPPLLAAFYLSFVLQGQPISSGWYEGFIFLAALLVGATYVSVINDLTDRDEDRLAGKHNSMEGRSPLFIASLLLLLVSAGIAIGWLMRGNLPLVLAYAGAWLAYSCYSIPPVRLKAHGALGVIADAAGAHFFPTLMAVFLAFEAMGRMPTIGWIAVMAAWSGAAGIRFIVAHQVADEEADRASETDTFVRRHGRIVGGRLAKFAAFPVELIALFTILAVLPTSIPSLALAAYALAAAGKLQRHKMKLVFAIPRPRPLILLVDYYEVFLPISLLIGAALVHPADGLVLALHCILFAPRILRELWVGGWALVR